MTHPLDRPALWVLLLLLTLPACVSQADKRTLQYLNTEGFGKRYTGNAEEADYVTLGDTVILRVVHADGEESTTHNVAIDGTILLEDLGAVSVAGLTRTDIESLLTEKYSAVLDLYQVQAQIRSDNKQYFIYGEVASEGPKVFTGDLTIWEAVMQAGPTRDSSNLGRVRLIRPDPVDPYILYVDVNDMIALGDSTYNVHVMELDIIYVPPTLVAQLGYFLDALLFPVKQVVSGLASALLLFDGRFYGAGGGRRGIGGGGTFF